MLVFIYIEKMDYKKITRDTYSAVSKNWDSKREYYWEPVVNFIKEFESPESLKFLDLGCGAGRHLKLAEETGFTKKNILGCDYSEGQIFNSKEKGFKVVLCDMEKLKFEDNSFDVVICIAAHHHLLDKESQLKALKEMKRVLREGGKILISEWMPEKEYLGAELEKKKFVYVDDKKKIAKVTYTDLSQNKVFDRYYYLFSEEEISKLCEEAGFKVEKVEIHKGNLYLTLS